VSVPNLLRDVRYALRVLIKRPGFAATAILVLSLGIGANAAVFSVVNVLLLKPLPGRSNGSELLGLYNKHVQKAGEFRPFSYPNFSDIRDAARSFSSVAAFDMALAGVTDGDVTRRAFVCLVSANYFDALGTKLGRGRTFTVEEERPGRPSLVTIVSNQYWRKRGSDPNLVGRSVRVSGRLFTVVGIAPPELTGTTVGLTPEFWMPLSAAELLKNDFMRDGRGKAVGARDAHELLLIGRLRASVDRDAADRDLAGVAARLAEAYPTDNRDYTIISHPLRRMGISTEPGGEPELISASAVLMAMSAIVLLVACLNLANMLLARGAARRKEIAIRLSLGAGRAAVVRQLLTENFLLSLGGGLAGLLLAYWATTLLVQSVLPLMPIPVAFDVAPDWRVLAATFAFAMLATLTFGLVPALRATRPGVVGELKEQAGEDRGRRAWRFGARNLLLASQMALSLALLAAGALFIRGALKAADATPGFGVDRGLIVEVDPSLAAFTPEQSAAAHRGLLAHLRTVRGIEAVSMASIVPFGAVNEGESVERSSARQGGARERVGATYTVISGDYFRSLNLPAVRGREFTPQEAEGTTARRVAIIDEPLAKRLFPAAGDDPIGQFVQVRVTEPGEQPEPLEIVGVVPGVRNELFDRAATPHLYVPFSLKPRTWMNYHVRVAAGGPGETAVLEQVRREIRAYDERMPILTTKTLRAFVAESLFLWLFRSAARIFTAFGAAALLLALVGIYGVNAYVVARRTREIGIRMALGATAGDVVRLILGEATVVIAAGVSLGLLMAIGIGWGLRSMLYDVTAFDPVALAGAPLLLAASALAASYLPARRATRVAPVSALRHE
jgi:predicted permease